MTFDQRDNGGLFVVRDGDLVTLTPVDRFPDPVAAVVYDHLDQIVGEPMVNVTAWPQNSDDDHKPAVLAFDQAGMLTAVVLAGANDVELIVARVQATLDWLTELTLRDVLEMHESVDALVDRLLDLNPNEVRLSLDPGRRMVIVTLCDLGSVQGEVESIAPNLTVVDLEVFADPSGADSLIRRIPSADRVASAADPTVVEAMSSTLDDEVEPTPAAGLAESVEPDDFEDDANADEIVDAAANEDLPTVDTDEGSAAPDSVNPTVVNEADQQSSLAPPPVVVPVLTPGVPDGRSVELPFIAGRTVATSELLATLGQLGSVELFDDGTITLGDHVLLTQVLSDDADLDSPTHFHRAVDDAAVARFQGWYDGDLANVRFHLVVRNSDSPAESTYLGELKPTAWEHMSGGQQLLFKIVPRIGAGLWQMMSIGELPPIETVIDLTGPTADQELLNVEVD
ncbi:MAG: hypothetical protein V3V01_14280 [Acidimicrobiales bacterium]